MPLLRSYFQQLSALLKGLSKWHVIHMKIATVTPRSTPQKLLLQHSIDPLLAVDWTDWPHRSW